MRKFSFHFLLFTLLVLSLPNGLRFTLPLFAEESITVTGTVAPKTTDFQFAFATTDNKTTVPQNETLSYQITYGAETSAGVSTNTVIVADFSDAKASDGTKILDYVSGSASTAYGNTHPVIDLLNQTLTWSISSLPAGTKNQTVTFSLKTNNNYTNTTPVDFTTKAKMSNQYVNLPDQSIQQTYQYNLSSVTPTSTPGPTNTPTPGPTSSPTPGASTGTQTPTPTPATSTKSLSISDVSFSTITANTATISISTSTPSQITLHYGTAANNLSKAIRLATSQSTNHSINLENLTSSTNYYFQILATDANGEQINSDIFIFKTAEASTPPTVEDNLIVISSRGNVLVSDVKNKNTPSNAMAIVTIDTPYEITYRLKHKMQIKSIEAVMRNKNVLGINTFSKTLGTQTIVVAMQETAPSVYVGHLKTDIAGTFDVFVRIQDTKGNVIEEKVAETKIMPYFSVYDKQTNRPIADARVFFLHFNPKTRKYESLTHEVVKPLTNPEYTNTKGEVTMLLPQGKYRAEVSAFGYDSTTTDMTIGTNPGEEFPRVFLQPNPTGFINYLNYYANALTDLGRNLYRAINNLAFSVRFFNIIAAFILGMAIVTTFLFFHMRTHVSPTTIIPYFIHHFQRLFKKNALSSFCATIADEEGNKISQAQVETIDETTGEVITSFVSNKNGICYILNPKQRKKLNLLITKEGFTPKTIAVESDITPSHTGVTIVMEKGHKAKNTFLNKTWLVMENIGGLFFELSLFSSLVLEFLFFSLFGFGKTAPFFVLSILNLLLWIFYQQEKQERKVFKKP